MKIFALVDCNNFYASCERVFDPRLKGRAIVILSNNDGCIVARSNEAKALGIPMGVPLFEQKAIIKKHNVAVFSSNYQLYGDMSQRVMDSLRLHALDMEVYSIDEAFLRLDPLQPRNLYEYCKTIRAKVLQWTGIPVSIGIGPTKVLAKVANHVAKKQTDDGIFDIRSQQAQDEILKTLDVGKIWGIAGRWSERLNRMGINKAAQLRDASPTIIRKHLSVVGERILRELKGQSCIDLEGVQSKKSIMSSKSFGKLLTKKEPIEEALANYAARACEKLRKQNSRAQAVHVFVQTNGFRETDPQYNNGFTHTLTTPTSDTRLIIEAAKFCLSRIYKPGYRYKKTGIMLTGLIPASLEQKQLFVDVNHHNPLMAIVDRINEDHGSDTLFFGAQGVNREWKMRCGSRSPRYTTQWDELLMVR
ncbi:MAG: Y-family DNA polymerase [Nitrospinae bacterium]|nr:Y-family DNA polymerase [Nitrospinota bacterium]MBL7019239.1 Y-family DNA polymerase [Nitrospinaceae bacterium]